ncbi:MFS transporter [Streptomyces sp. NPDC006655]|uniref:MFS transporter n=1 Tax=Streptomyces sp. NPDC006655 TaxID=3156898 RepID=UPI00345269D0
MTVRSEETTVPAAPAAPTRFTGRMAAALLALSIAQFLVALDYSIIYVALPSIGAGLDLAPERLQWVVSAYAVFFASFLVVGGRAADLTGPRRLFLGALALFGLGSLAAGLAGDQWLLIASRAAQGIGAAALTPSMLALIGAAFPAGNVRSRALAIWGAIGAVGLAAGVLIGGVLTSALSWRWVFFVNVPLILVTVALALRVLPAGARTRASVRNLNVPGAALFTGAVLCLVAALSQAAVDGWTSGSCLGCLAAAVALAAAWTAYDRRPAATPLIPRTLLRVRSLAGASAMSALYMASVGAEFFLITLFLQDVWGYGALEAGIAFLPLTLSVVAGNLVTGRLAQPWGIRRTLATGFAVGAAGLALLGIGTNGSGYWTAVLPGLLVSGLGQGMAFAGMYIGGTKDVPDSEQGTASAVLTTTQYTGGAMGLAVLVLMLGDAPGDAAFGRAYALTAVLALVAAATALTTLSTRAGDGRPDVRAEDGTPDARAEDGGPDTGGER